MIKRHIAFLIVLLASCTLGACGIWGDEEEKLEGERISILDLRKDSDLIASGESPVLPEQSVNKLWLEQKGSAPGAVGHLALAPDLRERWSTSIGRGDSTGLFNFAQPLVAGNGIFTLDSEGRLSGYRLSSGEKVWSQDLFEDAGDETTVNGAMALGERRLFVSLGNGHVFAIAPADGVVLWHKKVGGLIRSAPTTSEGRVFVMTLDNVIYAFDGETGEELWSYQGLGEGAAVLGNSGLAASGDIVVAPLSNGEIVTLRADSGRLLWIDTLAIGRSVFSELNTITDNRSKPVIYDGVVYVSSNAGRIGAFQAATGRRIWSRRIGGTQSPLVVGDYLFVVDHTQMLYCLNRLDGKALWARQLPRFENEDEKDGTIVWAGPVLAGNTLIVTGSNGEILRLDPAQGETQAVIEESGRFFIAPVVADEHLIVLNNSAQLSVYQ